MMNDNHKGHLPYCNGTVIDFQRVLEDLLGFAVVCWPWIDLVILRLGSRVFDVRNAFQAKFKTEVPLRHLDGGWRRITFAHGGHRIRYFYRKDQFIDSRGESRQFWKAYIKLSDNPPRELQQKIVDLLNHCRCRWWLSELELAIDVIPEDFSSFGSTVRSDADPLVVSAATSKSRGVPLALVEIQDVVDRHFHVPHSRKESLGGKETTSYRGKKGMKNKGAKGAQIYPGPKHIDDYSLREFVRAESKLNRPAIRRWMKTGHAGIQFPLEVHMLDFGAFFQLKRVKDVGRLAKTLYRLHPLHSDSQPYDGLALLTIRNCLEGDLEVMTHTEFRDQINLALGGKNLAYHFETLFPIPDDRQQSIGTRK